MTHLAVVCSPGLADGFRLTGAAVSVHAPGAATASGVRAMLNDEELGVLLVTDDLWSSLDQRTRADLEYLPRPLVLAIPAGAVSETAARRELLDEMLERAIGYRIELSGVPSRRAAGAPAGEPP